MEQEADENMNIKCLYAILRTTVEADGAVEDDEGIVTMEKFGQILQWFGPIVEPTQKKVVLLDTVCQQSLPYKALIPLVRAANQLTCLLDTVPSRSVSQLRDLLSKEYAKHRATLGV
jgi:hypothetical protein